MNRSKSASNLSLSCSSLLNKSTILDAKPIENSKLRKTLSKSQDLSSVAVTSKVKNTLNIVFMPLDLMIGGILFLSCLSVCLSVSVCLLSTLTFAIPYRSRGPLIFPRIGVGNEGVCPRRRPRRYGTVYLYRALTWSSVVLWSCRHDASPVSRPTWTYVVLLSCRHSRKAIKPDGVA